MRNDSYQTVCIVEAEKTAIIASIKLPEFTWLATGSKQSLKVNRLQAIGRRRKVVLYPDADGFDSWHSVAKKARMRGFEVSVSSLIQTRASEPDRSSGCDIADYLIRDQQNWNAYVELFNAKLERVLSDDELYEDCQTILDEQKAILIRDGHFSKDAAERKVTNTENIRRVVMSV